MAPASNRDRRGTALVPTATSFVSRSSTDLDASDVLTFIGRIYT